MSVGLAVKSVDEYKNSLANDNTSEDQEKIQLSCLALKTPKNKF
jgi:hypothetical protein